MTARERPPTTVHEAREAYFSGRITAAEYLQQTLPVIPVDRGLSDQLRRILERLTGKGRARLP